MICGYISAEKGIPGFPGCLKHTSVISQLIKEATETNVDLTCVSLDVANTVPHNFIETAHEYYIYKKRSPQL